MKVRIGSGDLKSDVQRVKKLRETIGPNIGLLADINQALTRKQAIPLGLQLDDFELQ